MSETTSSYPYASARIKALESKLLTKEKLNRMIEAKDYESALHVLQEMGYGQSASGHPSLDALIMYELGAADELLAAISPNDDFTLLMRAQKDYYNLKVLIKLMMLDQNLESIPLVPGNIAVEVLRRALIENNYYELPEPMKEALLYIDRQYAVASDVSVVGVALDRAYAKEVNALVERLGDPLISTYFQSFFDLSNIIAFFRVRLSDYGKESFENAYVKGGRIEKSAFSDAFDLSDDNVFSAIVKGDYTRVLAAAFEDYRKTRDLYMMEKSRDDYLLQMLREKRFDMFGIGPLMGYYLAKQREAAAIRMVMTAKQGGIGTDTVSKRMKELF